MYLVYLSIWSGVGDLSVSATSQFRPLTHIIISSSDVAEDDSNIKGIVIFPFIQLKGDIGDLLVIFFKIYSVIIFLIPILEVIKIPFKIV